MTDGADPESATTRATSERWKRLEALFDAASQLPDGERAAHLERACPDDPELRAQVAALLANADGAEPLRDAVAAELQHVAGPRAAMLVGGTIGPYRLTELLGEGGMGVVYLATRDDTEYRREVAIKILPHGFRSEHAIGRFRDERQILATLEHPGIVRLLEGGTEDGLPYLVLERVDGVPLTRHAAERELSVRAKLELIVRVCDALQYAHGKLVVHRDLKPSNILVDASGTPKLLDFGIAKLLDPAADLEREARTRTGMMLFTPEYASPEQVRGEPVSVATDVYSLGAVLYELLTSKPPQAPAGSLHEVQRAICEVDPPRASAAAPALARELAGDLDNILAKALHKEPSQRYGSIKDLADDLRRHLAGLPVEARAATFGYRSAKFVRRNRGKLTLATVVVATLIAATAISLHQARRAEAAAHRAGERSQKLHLLASSLLFEIDEAIRDLAGTTHARKLVVMRALENLKLLERDPDLGPTLNRDLAIAYMRIGDIQGSPWEPNIGQQNEGLQSYQKAAELLAGLDAKADPRIPGARIAAEFGIGFMHHSNRDIARARTSLLGALEAARRSPTGLEVDGVMQARAHLALAFDAKEANDIVESERYTDAGLALVGHWDARTVDARYWRASFLLRRADTAARAGDPDRAAMALREIVGLHASLAAEQPNQSKYPREQGYALLLLGIVTSGVGDSRLWVANTGDLAAAEDAFRRGLAIFERRAADDPEDADSRMLVAVFRTSLGLALAQRSTRDAMPMFIEALAAYDRIPPGMRTKRYGRENEYILHCAMAHALAAHGKPDEARRRATHGLELAKGDAFYVAMCEALVARMHRELGETDQAAARLEAVARTLRPLAGRPDTSAVVGLVETLQQLAQLRPADTCRFDLEAVEHLRARGATSPYLRRRGEELAAAAAACE